MDHTDDIEFLLKKVLSLQTQVRLLYFLVIVLIGCCLYLVFKPHPQVYPVLPVSNVPSTVSTKVSSGGGGRTNEEIVTDATLIVYGKSKIVNNQIVTSFDKVLWADDGIEVGYELGHVLNKDFVRPGTSYGNGQILFYMGADGKNHFSTWYEHDGYLPGWEDKSLDEFIQHLNEIK